MYDTRNIFGDEGPICVNCHGSGTVDTAGDGHFVKCSRCGGSGIEPSPHNVD